MWLCENIHKETLVLMSTVVPSCTQDKAALAQICKSWPTSIISGLFEVHPSSLKASRDVLYRHVMVDI
jgi:hypothetical protein